ncbi:hypothetical protein Fcan01_21377 [Folsomia candida]|uniref:Uncharacterized protein n=1 Tax=Folsomia candida TaxID=158441 RepID=A0A226DFX6_FOLCA|nr:hypothetical protein Fcan01_21377 [Folsomia candida]
MGDTGFLKHLEGEGVALAVDAPRHNGGNGSGESGCTLPYFTREPEVRGEAAHNQTLTQPTWPAADQLLPRNGLQLHLMSILEYCPQPIQPAGGISDGNKKTELTLKKYWSNKHFNLVDCHYYEREWRAVVEVVVVGEGGGAGDNNSGLVVLVRKRLESQKLWLCSLTSQTPWLPHESTVVVGLAVLLWGKANGTSAFSHSNVASIEVDDASPSIIADGVNQRPAQVWSHAGGELHGGGDHLQDA